MSGGHAIEQGISALQSWKIGQVMITKVVESQTVVDLATILPKATAESLLALPWLQPHFITADGRGVISVHALVVDTPTTRIIVDTCNGNDKNRLPWEFITNLQTSFLRDLESAGFRRESFDVVLCTHLHMDHTGWNTMRVGDKWLPTFPRARYLLNKTEYEYWAAPYNLPPQHGWAEVQGSSFSDSIRPVVDAGLVDLVDGVYPVCNEVTLLPTPGHSPGHVSVRISSMGEEALITGDVAHHPSQLVHLDWGTAIDFDTEQAIKTRQRLFSDVADRPILVIGTHWAGVTAGRVRRSGPAFRLDYDQ
jgi:glyoxylase-like metal-dependent hydrolase (beta-lactamase superfamily II)